MWETESLVQYQGNCGVSFPVYEHRPLKKNAVKKTRMETEQWNELVDVFRRTKYPSKQKREELAAKLQTSYKKITKWFDNGRSRERKGRKVKKKSNNGHRSKMDLININNVISSSSSIDKSNNTSDTENSKNVFKNIRNNNLVNNGNNISNSGNSNSSNSSNTNSNQPEAANLPFSRGLTELPPIYNSSCSRRIRGSTKAGSGRIRGTGSVRSSRSGSGVLFPFLEKTRIQFLVN